jgi:uncharacterized phage infection (PIP) family protein YhgE
MTNLAKNNAEYKKRDAELANQLQFEQNRMEDLVDKCTESSRELSKLTVDMNKSASKCQRTNAELGQLQIKNQRTNAELGQLQIKNQRTNADLEEANDALVEINAVYIQTNTDLEEANNILELGISNLIIDTLNLPKRGGKLTLVGRRRLMSTIGILATARIIEKRGQFSNWVLRTHMTLDDLRNVIRATLV